VARQKKTAVLKGTLDLLILRTLELAPRHGVGVADRIEQMTRGTFALGAGSLFPALHRLEQRGLIRGEWKETEEGRRARFYELTPVGRRQLVDEKRLWARIVLAMRQVLETEP
jgi:PadR family transcriptional regulator PadR